MMELKKQWFEPGPDGESPFVRKYNASPGTAGEAVAAAFRALIAGEEATEPPALRVGDVVRLERWEDGTDGMDFYDNLNAIVGKECPILAFSKVYPNRALVYDALWPVSACTLVRRAGEAAPVAKDAEIARLMAEVERVTSTMNLFQGMRDQAREHAEKLTSELHARNDEIVGLRAEVERLKSECSDQQRYVLDLESAIARKETRIKVLEVANDSLTQYSSNLTAERDALQARFDAGVPEVCAILEVNHDAR